MCPDFVFRNCVSKDSRVNLGQDALNWRSFQIAGRECCCRLAVWTGCPIGVLAFHPFCCAALVDAPVFVESRLTMPLMALVPTLIAGKIG